MILAFAHPGLVVPDLEAASRFYADMFGFREIGARAGKTTPRLTGRSAAVAAPVGV